MQNVFSVQDLFIIYYYIYFALPMTHDVAITMKKTQIILLVSQMPQLTSYIHNDRNKFTISLAETLPKLNVCGAMRNDLPQQTEDY
jgi:hypothetical protein